MKHVCSASINASYVDIIHVLMFIAALFELFIISKSSFKKDVTYSSIKILWIVHIYNSPYIFAKSKQENARHSYFYSVHMSFLGRNTRDQRPDWRHTCLVKVQDTAHRNIRPPIRKHNRMHSLQVHLKRYFFFKM